MTYMLHRNINVALQQPNARRRVGTRKGASRAQTRTNALIPCSLPPPLVDPASDHRGKARRTSGSRGGPSDSADGIWFKPRRAADVHLCAEKSQALAGAGGRAARLHPIGRELRSGCWLVRTRGAPWVRVA